MPDFTMCCDEICPYKKRCKRSVESGTKPTPTYQAWGIFLKIGDSSKPENCMGWKPINEVKHKENTNKHKWKCTSVGLYDSTYKCKKCNRKYTEAVDKIDGGLPVFGCKNT